MPRRPTPLPPALGDTFTCAQARALGVSEGRLRAQDLAAPHRGVRTPATPDAPADTDLAPLARDRATRHSVWRRAQAYAAVIPPTAFFIGPTAAVLLGMPAEHPATAPLHVGVLAPDRPPRAKGVRARQLSPALTTVREEESLRVSSPASTWAMLAGQVSRRELVRLGDAIVRIPRGAGGRLLLEEQLATLAQLASAAWAPHRRHRAALVEALGQIRVGSMSPLETDFRLDAADAGLPEPELDVEIRDENGRLLGISELVYRRWRAIVEIEGDHHRTDRAQWNRDIEKYAAYTAAGWEVIRLTSAHVRGASPRACAIVREVLLRRGWMPPPSTPAHNSRPQAS